MGTFSFGHFETLLLKIYTPVLLVLPRQSLSTIVKRWCVCNYQCKEQFSITIGGTDHKQYCIFSSCWGSWRCCSCVMRKIINRKIRNRLLLVKSNMGHIIFKISTPVCFFSFWNSAFCLAQLSIGLESNYTLRSYKVCRAILQKIKTANDTYKIYKINQCFINLIQI